MSVNAMSGVGTTFLRGDGASSESFSAIAEINSIGGPGMSRDMIDVTDLDSTGGYKEYIPSFRDGENVTLNMNFTRDGYIDMLNDFESDDAVNYQIKFADTGATTITFAGFVQGIPLSITPTDKITLDVTIKVSGQITVES